MKAMIGNSSNLAAFSKLFIKVSNLSETHQIHGFGGLNLLRIRLFSSFGGHHRDEQGRRNGRNDYDNVDVDDDDKFSGRRNRGNFSGQRSFGNQGLNPGGGGRPARSDGQRSQFGGQNAAMDRDNWSRGRRNDGFNKLISEDKGGRPSVESGEVGLETEKEKENYQPSVRELLKGPPKGGKHGGDFLDKFKLGDDGEGKQESKSDEVHSTPAPEEEKMEVTQDAEEIFNKMKKSGLIPNAVTMLDGLCKDGLVHEAMKLFGLMRDKGTMPEVVVYTAVVEGYCQAQKIDDAKRIFKKMQDNGIVPNAYSYTILLKGLCDAKRLEEATDLCVEMLEAGHSPNVPTFTRLVEESCQEKGLEDAKKVILTLRQKGFFLDEKAVRVYYDKTGPTSSVVWEAIFGPKKTTR